MATSDFSHLQDVMGCLPMLKRYIVICLAFPSEDNVSLSAVEDALRGGLRSLAVAFPYLAGQVVMEGRDVENTGRPKIIPWRQDIELIMNDLRDTSGIPSMRDMCDARYPFSMLQTDTLVPGIAASWSAEGFESVAPVFLLQANVIKGGTILTIATNHMTSDMTGMGMIISLFSKACRAEPFADEEIKQGNQPRRNAVPLLGPEYQPGPELVDVMVKPRAMEEKNIPHSRATPPPSPGSPPKWVYFNFTAAKLARLKIQASEQTIVPYISTDDAVGALCWQSIARARAKRMGNDVRTQFARPISGRKYLGLQGYYLGHMVDVVYEGEVDVWTRPLGEVAGRLRRLLLEDDKIRYHIRAFATMLDRLPDKTQLANGATLNLQYDMVVSSYANIRCCELSFGSLLGKPEAARRPQMPAWPSLLYLMPKSRDGDIAVAFCLSVEDVAQLRRDANFMEFAEFVG